MRIPIRNQGLGIRSIRFSAKLAYMKARYDTGYEEPSDELFSTIVDDSNDKVFLNSLIGTSSSPASPESLHVRFPEHYSFEKDALNMSNRFLYAFPACNITLLSDDDMRTRIRFILGIDPYFGFKDQVTLRQCLAQKGARGGQTLCVKCHQNLRGALHPAHALFCRSRSKIPQHDRIVNLVNRFLVDRHFAPERELRVAPLQSSNSAAPRNRGDIEFYDGQSSGSIGLDVVVSAGSLVLAENEKFASYNRLPYRYGKFVPLAFDIFGRLAPEAEAFFAPVYKGGSGICPLKVHEKILLSCSLVKDSHRAFCDWSRKSWLGMRVSLLTV